MLFLSYNIVTLRYETLLDINCSEMCMNIKCQKYYVAQKFFVECTEMQIYCINDISYRTYTG